MCEVVPEVGLREKLHLGLGNPTRMHHGSMLATSNRLPKSLWSLNTIHLLWSYRNRGLGDQAARKAPPPWEKKAALTAGSHSTGKGHAGSLPVALG